jgi:hypothetical protein
VLLPFVHGEGTPAQRDRGIRVARQVLAGALLYVCLDVPDRVIQALDQKIEQCCQAIGLHFSNDLECRLTPIKFVN